MTIFRSLRGCIPLLPFRQCHTRPGQCHTGPQPLASVVDYWTEWLETRSIPEARESVNLITAHVMGKKMIHEVSKDQVLDNTQMTRIEEMCENRSKRMPVQYILGEWDFHELNLKMRPPVFIPRPETEELAMFACEDLQEKHSENLKVLELGSGSGAISVYLLNRLPKISVVAVDKCEKACALTRENADLTNVLSRMKTIQLDYSQPGSSELLKADGPFDMIVANPPYVTTAEVKQMEVELTEYEDPDAFHGGEDGLIYVRYILTMSHLLLKSDCNLWLEVGLHHCDTIKLEVTDNLFPGLKFLSAVQDFTKRDRFCVLQRT